MPHPLATGAAAARRFRAAAPRWHDAPVPEEPDYRFTYANERTFLAWVRTSVALIGVGVAAVQFLPPLDVPGGRRALGTAFIVLGAVICVIARQQWVANDQAMRAGAALPRSVLVPVVTLGVVLLAAVVAVLSLLG
jgi:putative membrane protein